MPLLVRHSISKISAKIPLQDFFGQFQHTDLIGFWWAILGLPTGTDGVSSQWQRVEATPLRANSASTRSFNNELWVRWGVAHSLPALSQDVPEHERGEDE